MKLTPQKLEGWGYRTVKTDGRTGDSIRAIAYNAVARKNLSGYLVI